MRKIKTFFVLAIGFFWACGCAHTQISLFAPQPEKFSIVKVSSDKKYLQLMSRTRGVLGTGNWGKFNYDVVKLPYNKQGEYFTITWKRAHGPKKLDKDVVLRIEYKHQNGKVGKVEKVYSRLKRGRQMLTFENTGDLFVDNGEIELWHVSILVGNKVMAEEESALWWTVSKFKS